MNSRRILILALAVTFGVTTGGAFAGDDVIKPAVKRAAVVKESSRAKKEVSAAKPAARVWHRSSEQPCDSTACRPFRFAWSPVAPGA